MRRLPEVIRDAKVREVTTLSVSLKGRVGAASNFTELPSTALAEDIRRATMARLGRQPPVVGVNKTDYLRVRLQAAATAALPSTRSRKTAVGPLMDLA